MHKSATKCNEILGKWCKNKHGASKIMDTLETYHTATRPQRRPGAYRRRALELDGGLHNSLVAAPPPYVASLPAPLNCHSQLPTSLPSAAAPRSSPKATRLSSTQASAAPSPSPLCHHPQLPAPLPSATTPSSSPSDYMGARVSRGRRAV
jgi:hypothetical protein